MRRIALAAFLLLAAPASAAAPQVTDPAGDSLPEYDLTAVTWSAGATTQRVALAFADGARAQSARYVVRFATPACGAATWVWHTGAETSFLDVCGDLAWPAPAVVAGQTVTFAAPLADLPFAPGTRLSKLGADAAPFADIVVGALYPPLDSASSDATYVAGS